MKKISKILSSVLAASLIASCFVTSVLAGTPRTITLATDKTEGLKAGDTVVVTVKIDKTENLSSCGYALAFDATAFDVDTTKGWMSMKDYGMHENFADQAWYDAMKGEPFGSILNPSFSYPEAGLIKFAGAGSMGIPAPVAAADYLIGKYIFTVKSDAVNGDYEFKLNDLIADCYTSEPGENAGTALTGNVLKVTVGEKAPATTDKAYYAEVTYGEKAKAATGIKFNLSTDDTAAKSKTAEKDVPFKAVVEAIEKIAVALNIEGIPNGVTVTVDSAELY